MATCNRTSWASKFLISRMLRKLRAKHAGPDDDALGELRILRAEVQALRKAFESLTTPGENLGPRLADAWIDRLIGIRGGDLVRLAGLAAALDSARHLSQRMGSPQLHETAAALRKAACGSIEPDGLVLEFGVGKGKSITQIAEALPLRTIHGFDSFEGLPEAWRPGFRKGRFAQPPPAVPSNVELVIGLFEETLPRFLEEHPGSVALLHVDCDLYSSTRTVLRMLSGRIRPGTVIVFDEYFNYPGWQLHEHRAFLEWVEARGVEVEYAGIVQRDQQVMMIVKHIGAAPSA